MYFVYNGRDLDIGQNEVTNLEQALSIFPHLKNFKSLNQRLVEKVEQMMKQQAVLVCVKQHEFTLAKQVKDRVWRDRYSLDNDGQDIGFCLDQVIRKQTVIGFDLPSSFDDLMQLSVNLLEDLCEHHLPLPYLIQLASNTADVPSVNKQSFMMSLYSAVHASVFWFVRMSRKLLGIVRSTEREDAKPAVSFLSSYKSKVQRQEKQLEWLTRMPKEQMVSSAHGTSSRYNSLSDGGGYTEQLRYAKKKLPSYRQLLPVSPKNQRISNVDTTDDEYADHYSVTVRKRGAGSSDELFGGVMKHQHPVTPAIQHKPLRKRRAKWTEEEEATLIIAVKKFGLSNWATIAAEDILPGRSNVDMKDKWRSLVRSKRAEEIDGFLTDSPFKDAE